MNKLDTMDSFIKNFLVKILSVSTQNGILRKSQTLAGPDPIFSPSAIAKPSTNKSQIPTLDASIFEVYETPESRIPTMISSIF